MKVKLFLGSALVLLSASRAEAANVAVIATPPGILGVLVLLLAVAGAVVSFQTLGLVRGGLLSKGWQFFVAGFGLLALAQVLVLLNSMEILNPPIWLVPSLFVLMAGVFFFGIFKTRRVLG